MWPTALTLFRQKWRISLQLISREQVEIDQYLKPGKRTISFSYYGLATQSIGDYVVLGWE